MLEGHDGWPVSECHKQEQLIKEDTKNKRIVLKEKDVILMNWLKVNFNKTPIGIQI